MSSWMRFASVGRHGVSGKEPKVKARSKGDVAPTRAFADSSKRVWLFELLQSSTVTGPTRGSLRRALSAAQENAQVDSTEVKPRHSKRGRRRRFVSLRSRTSPLAPLRSAWFGDGLVGQFEAQANPSVPTVMTRELLRQVSTFHRGEGVLIRYLPASSWPASVWDGTHRYIVFDHELCRKREALRAVIAFVKDRRIPWIEHQRAPRCYVMVWPTEVNDPSLYALMAEAGISMLGDEEAKNAATLEARLQRLEALLVAPSERSQHAPWPRPHGAAAELSPLQRQISDEIAAATQPNPDRSVD